MDLTLGEEQTLLVETARGVLAERCSAVDVRRVAETALGFDRETWHEIGALGWLGIETPEALGGAAQGFVELVLLAEELGRALLPSPFVPGIAMALDLIQALADEAQREEWIPPLIGGEVVPTLALCEPGWRDPFGAPALEARTSGAGVSLSGTKSFVPFAAAADVLIVSVAGPGVVRVEGDAPGVTYRRQGTGVGDPVYEVAFDAAPGVLLCRGPAAAAALAGALDRGSLASLAYATGAAERALELSVEHANTREQFGRVIGSFQAVAHRCVDMRSDIDACRVLVHQAAWSLAAYGRAPLEVGAARAFGLEALRQVARHAHQVHGAIGFSTEHDLHLYTRCLKATELQWGTATRARDEVARSMGL